MYMKRNYIRMTGLGVKVNQPVFMRCKEQVEANGKEKDSEDDFYTQQIKRIKLTRVTVDLCDIRGKLGGRDSISASSIMPGVSTVRVNAWSHRLRERKTRVIYEEISDPEEDDDGDDDDDNNDDDDDY
ncbi:protein SSX1-like [Mesocricetus auratus]|uniref:Protein SSX1-like n=1 Tax=Mesocricetus auratus TaxID=10036 RepID=A0ABM2WFI6_MESAU|nr:protein SSX1-like [Mesocricetus auratus]